MKKPEEAMEILEAFDATGSLRGAAVLAGCDHKTVARLVAARDAAGGGLPERARQRPLVDPFAGKIDELVDRSRALVRADVVHGVLVAMGYAGSYRTTRRAVAEAKRRWRNKHGRRTRPWIPQPGLWLQWDYGDGPEVAGTRAVLFCAWLAWSRFRVVVPLRDKTLASVVIGLDRTLRMIDGVPTYALFEYVPGHIFEPDLREHATEPFERLHVQFEERLLGLDQRRLAERRPGERRSHHEQMHLDRHATEDHERLAPVDLRLDTGRVDLRNEHLPDHQAHRPLARADVLTDRRFRDISAVLIDETPVDPPRGVPLLARRGPVGLKPPIDHRPIPTELRGRATHRRPL